MLLELVNKSQKKNQKMKLQIKKIYFGKNVNTYPKEEFVEVYVTYEVLENIGTNEKIVF